MLRITKTENGMVKGLPVLMQELQFSKGIQCCGHFWQEPLESTAVAENWEGVRECCNSRPLQCKDTRRGPECFIQRNGM